jgi:hypothetical protein
MTTTAANKELVRRLYGGLMAKGDTAVAEEVLAEDYLDHDILGVGQGGRQELVGRAGRLVADQLGERERARHAGGCLTGPNPTDRGKPESTYHLLVDRRGIPLAACLSAANTHDWMLLEQVVDAVAPVKARVVGRVGRASAQPSPTWTKGSDDPRCRRALRRRGITPRIARRGIQSSQRLGRDR